MLMRKMKSMTKKIKDLFLASFLGLFLASLNLLSMPALAKASLTQKLTSPSQATHVNAVEHKPTSNVKSYSLELTQSTFASWGLDPKSPLTSINVRWAWSDLQLKKKVIVAVIDTGIQFDHPFLKDNLVNLKGPAQNSHFGFDFSDPSKMTFTPEDKHGHGTHVAGIIKSVFPNVKLLALKYYNPQASGQKNLEATIKALRFAVDSNVDVINYSGGGPEPSAEELKILKEAERKGILVVAAAGNEKSNIDDKKNAYYPASYGLPNIISVAAYDQDLQIISSSNWGKNSVDIAAPGFKIRSAIPKGGSGYMTGTSQATAFVTGVAALLKAQYPDLNAEALKNIIVSSSLKIKNFEGKILGAGKLDATQALNLAKSIQFRNANRQLAQTISP